MNRQAGEQSPVVLPHAAAASDAHGCRCTNVLPAIIPTCGLPSPTLKDRSPPMV